MSYFRRVRPQCKVESLYRTGTQKKVDAYSVDCFCGHWNIAFEAMGCYYHFRSWQETRTSLTEEKFRRGIKKRELDELRKQYIQERFIASLRCRNLFGGTCTRQKNLLNSICLNIFPTKNHSEKKDFWRISNHEIKWLSSMWIWSTRESPRNFCQLSAHLQEPYCW